jgi:hypothetical protein
MNDGIGSLERGADLDVRPIADGPDLDAGMFHLPPGAHACDSLRARPSESAKDALTDESVGAGHDDAFAFDSHDISLASLLTR